MTSSTPKYIVGIGASAGGLEALEHLFRQVEQGLGMAYVVVQHLSPDFKSQMDELLRRCTELPVVVAEHEMTLEADTVYLMPPRVELIVSEGMLLLTDRGEGLPLPIDQFMRSLAQDAASRAVAIVLSGTGSDGTRGVQEVHESSGLVIVQDPETAKFDGMPRSALETGIADLVLDPRHIPGALRKHVAGDPPQSSSPDSVVAVKEGGMRAVFSLLRERFGIDFSSYKPGTITRRTERRLQLGRSADLSAYIERLRDDRLELDALYSDLLIGVTGFFRDAEAFLRLEKDIVPEIVANATAGHELRVWAAGCATGEEAYTIAILLNEAIGRLDRPLSVKIFATDVHRPSLDFASAGLYPTERLVMLSKERLERFFVREDGGFRVSAELRRMIVFAEHNVIRDAPFTKLDLVTCRNLLIYFQPPVQRKVLSLFHFGLRHRGVMFLGPSESPGDVGDEFETINEHWRMYRKRRDVRLLPGFRSSPLAPAVSPAPSHRAQGEGETAMLDVFGTLLDAELPPSVLLDERYQILHTFGDVGPLLMLPRGRPSLGLLDMLDGELKLAVAGALHRAARIGEPVSFSGVRTRSAAGERQADIIVRQVSVRRSSSRYFLVSFRRAEVVPPPVVTQAIDLSQVSRDRLEVLEHELRHTKENLQATIEELEASNEELQATNEELLASNEELQSTNEELHSVNEELYTVNAEYQHKIDQLTELTDDMDNLLLSTEVHTLFLDANLCVRKFTPAIADVFNLVESDIGRRIEGFMHSIAFDNLSEALRHTVNTGERFEKEVETTRGNAFLMRLLPYHGRQRRAGVVLTLIDITAIREWQSALREQIEQRDRFLAMLSHELRNPLAAVSNAVVLLERRLPGDESVRRPVGLIREQARHMQRLLDDLLDVSRFTQGKIRLQLETVDLTTAAHQAVEVVRPSAESRRHTLEVEVLEEPLWVHADQTRLLQILENLLTNAVKYTPDGGRIVVTVEPELGTERARIIVGDNGVGLDERAKQKIFEMFVQGDDTLDRSQGGLGVGLTLVQSLVRLHDGDLEVQSEGPGKGSEFIVTLPRSVAPLEVANERPPESASSSAQRVVLVEDQEAIRASLAELLGEDGFDVVTASDGPSGLETIREVQPNVAVLDIGLPAMDGYEIARHLRSQPETAHIRLIAMTGYGADDDRQQVEAAGFDDHLVKPVMLEDLILALERVGVRPSAE